MSARTMGDQQRGEMDLDVCNGVGTPRDLHAAGAHDTGILAEMTGAPELRLGAAQQAAL
ncbi:MAG: hypothetical protein L0Y67_03040 [Gammaproteobacteria bacterium]|nr:hypothetical protein [Gammaproteobacteria bacterium]